MNLAAVLVRAEGLHGSKEAITCQGRTFTYGAFLQRVNRLAAVLREEGVKQGDAVAMLHRNCHHYLEAYFAAAFLGAVFVPLNTRLSTRELSFILEDSEAGILITEPCFEDQACSALEGLPSGAVRLFLSHGESNASLERLMDTAGDQPLEAMEAESRGLAHLYYTSGTTGKPKGVLLTHGNALSHALSTIAELGIRENDVWLHAAPLFHLADAWATWAITLAGGRHVLIPEFDPQGVFDCIESEGVTLTNLIPTMLVRLVNHPGRDPGKLKSMRRILSGGAPMALELLKEVEALFPCEYVQTYGLTETSPYLTMSLLKEHLKELPPEEQQRYRATTGRPVRGVDLRVVDEAGQEVPWDSSTVGEIVVKGPSVTPGYFKRPEEMAQAFKGGWLHTGDLAHVEPEGYLTIVDRKKDVINTGGEQVFSTEVENALYAHPAVEEAAVIAVPDDLWGETVKAVVVLKQGVPCASSDLIAHCREWLTSYKVPQSIDLVKALPRTGSGKLDKKALRAPFWAGRDKEVH